MALKPFNGNLRSPGSSRCSVKRDSNGAGPVSLGVVLSGGETATGFGVAIELTVPGAVGKLTVSAGARALTVSSSR